MTAIIGIAGFAVTLAVVLWNASILRRFKSDYRFIGEFPGKRYDCVVRFVNMEDGICCGLGADASALYLLPTACERPREMWSKRGTARQIFSTDLRIPWTDLEWQEKRMLFKACIWFEIPAKRIYFYVPRDLGDKLLVEGQQKIPSDFELLHRAENIIPS